MAIIKCKMCGGDLVLMPDSTVVECEYCGTHQTVPSADNEKKMTLFNRANRLRLACEFDKAAGVYEAIVADFPEEAEAYWGLVLCKYGIEYVDDPATARKIPTCHRSSFDSVMDDENFEQALENANAAARKVYRTEAKQIEEIRKGIIEVSSKEDPYDIFICYKETDENGDRTLDSVLAQDIYDALTEKGYRTFFARITLEDKLGQEYEPYIFAAQNSAKIMLVVGTDYEYYNAVWVKNEWSRFLHLIASGQKKTLIPCYKNIDAYDMPKEFAKLQAQDLGKVGAIQDLLRGIEKILPMEKKDSKAPAIIVQENQGTNISALLKRANMALEDGDWEKANSFCEKILNRDAENAEAYLCQALAQLRFRKLEELICARLQNTKSAEWKQGKLEPDNAHIQKMRDKYEVPVFLERAEITQLYAFDLKYTTRVPSRKQQRYEEEKFWKSHKLLSRALCFATGDFAGFLNSAYQSLLREMDMRISESERYQLQREQALLEKYQAHLMQTDERIAQLYTEALQKREASYEKHCGVVKNSSDIGELLNSIHVLQSLSDYKESSAMAQIGKQKKERLLMEKNQKEAARVEVEKKKQTTRKRICIFVACLVCCVIICCIAIIQNEQTMQTNADIEIVRSHLSNQTFTAMDSWSEGFSVHYHYFELVFSSDNTVTVYSLLRAGPKSNSDSLDLLGTYQYKLKKTDDRTYSVHLVNNPAYQFVLTVNANNVPIKLSYEKS